MNDLARIKLKELIVRFGTSVAEDPARCRGMLKDVCGECRKEIAGLMAALEERVPAELAKPGISIDIIRARLSNKLEEDRGLAKEVAIWSVDTWALALNLITESQLRSVAPSAAEKVTAQAPPVQAVPVQVTPVQVSSVQASPAPVTPPTPINPIPVVPSVPTPPRYTISEKEIDLGNGITIELVKVPAGSFMMGARGESKGGLFGIGKREGSDDEYPQHRVNVPAFLMGKYPVTQIQYQTVMGENPSYFNGDRLPVERVSWHQAQEFCQKITQLRKIVRLPSEAEWEYACRAGSTGLYCYGDDENKLGEYAWYSQNSGSTTHPVGQKKPNNWELYDMHGNVWEWCEDNWHENYNGAPTNGSAWITGGEDKKLLRGGCWYLYANSCRAAYRNRFVADFRSNNFGFRVVCALQ